MLWFWLQDMSSRISRRNEKINFFLDEIEKLFSPPTWKLMQFIFLFFMFAKNWFLQFSVTHKWPQILHVFNSSDAQKCLLLQFHFHSNKGVKTFLLIKFVKIYFKPHACWKFLARKAHSDIIIIIAICVNNLANASKFQLESAFEQAEELLLVKIQ